MNKKLWLIPALLLCSSLSAEDLHDANSIAQSNGIQVDKQTLKPVSGIYRTYYENGEIWHEVSLKNGQKHGVLKEYSMSGELRGETSYADGKRNGMQKMYFRSGELMMEITYKNDKQDGVTKEYSKEGNLLKESRFKDGKLEE